jgi:hypothetical protein
MRQLFPLTLSLSQPPPSRRDFRLRAPHSGESRRNLGEGGRERGHANLTCILNLDHPNISKAAPVKASGASVAR